ncbi:hypothetical protein [Chitinivibrio alkaliphilus]|uniref:Uncharacterized protein n=1 Tax=Chitinivibrio alkaliphilus ACht1 TaxID=1313304 RepID=U7D4F5_9BACT|nr:hypothetical protein [Chitinivibrio alkaliphilus]ERP31374.1 hypothetical protein CALK_1721 [Chitinivibrio alkaliphilus ACht1]
MISESDDITRGMAWDTSINIKEVYDVFDALGVENPEKLLRMCLHELENSGLIYTLSDASTAMGYDTFGPTNEFFYQTDEFCQNWTPSKDALELIKIADEMPNRTCDNSVACKKLNWPIRRMNSALKFLESGYAIEELSNYAGMSQFFDISYTLTDEADFLLENEV